MAETQCTAAFRVFKDQICTLSALDYVDDGRCFRDIYDVMLRCNVYV